MQYKTVTLLALASAAVASPQLHKRQDDSSPTTVDQNSIASVLITALPSSLLSVALTNQAAVSSIIASEVAAGSPQPWISALPSDIQSYLFAAATAGVSITAAPTATPTAGANATSALSSIVSSVAAGNSSSNATTTGSSASSTSSSSEESSAASESSSATGTRSGSSASASSTGGAALPTAVGAGLAGVVGIIGMLAL
ncbi:hypothetical protein GTA08_BOTSDO04983 [Botryosphaeria dothidea]|uniref:Uncharacterized protein n=1 Tax=Botryosphaeria dothidea TaxID=55169 RepID=A0A8H4ITA4_9PEZI|nr:hypothetical protein GTA08_BOTSDO04983 [Botryosphaeria dothidea]